MAISGAILGFVQEASEGAGGTCNRWLRLLPGSGFARSTERYRRRRPVQDPAATRAAATFEEDYTQPLDATQDMPGTLKFYLAYDDASIGLLEWALGSGSTSGPVDGDYTHTLSSDPDDITMLLYIRIYPTGTDPTAGGVHGNYFDYALTAVICTDCRIQIRPSGRLLVTLKVEGRRANTGSGATIDMGEPAISPRTCVKAEHYTGQFAVSLEVALSQGWRKVRTVRDPGTAFDVYAGYPRRFRGVATSRADGTVHLSSSISLIAALYAFLSEFHVSWTFEFGDLSLVIAVADCTTEDSLPKFDGVGPLSLRLSGKGEGYSLTFVNTKSSLRAA